VKPKLKFEMSLPRMDAMHADTLGESLVTALRSEKRLPASIAPAAARLERAHADLAEAARDRPNPPTQKSLRKAQAEEGAAWSALYDVLGAMVKLPDLEVEKREDARELLRILFPSGLRWFIGKPFETGYQEATSRLEQIERLDLEGRIVELGGAVVLRSIRRAHAQSGELLGITKPRVPGPAAVQLRERRDAFLGALKEYALQVTAYASQAREGAPALAARLLEPLGVYVRRTRRSRKASDEVAPPVEAPAPEPVVPAGPDR
jgi:hypothetical protein